MQDSVTDIHDIKPQKLKISIDITEVKSAITKLKDNKNPGCDNYGKPKAHKPYNYGYQLWISISIIQ